MKLSGQVGIVTGVGRGIAKGIALALAREGMALAVTSRSVDQLDLLGSSIAEQGGRAIAVVGDEADPSDVERVVRHTVEVLGPVDLLVYNAGRGPERFCPLWEADMTDWWDVLRVNVLGPALGCHAGPEQKTARNAPSWVRQSTPSRLKAGVVALPEGRGRRPTPTPSSDAGVDHLGTASASPPAARKDPAGLAGAGLASGPTG